MIRILMYGVLFIVGFLLVPHALCAGTVVVSDPYTTAQLQPTHFIVVVDGSRREVEPERFPDGTSRLLCDVGALADGPHTLRIKAVNSAVNPKSPLESPEVLFSFTKKGTQSTPTKQDTDKRAPTRSLRGYLKEEL